MTLTVFSPPLTGRRAAAGRLLAATVLAGQAMASLDTAIVNVAGPAIQRDLALSDAWLQVAVYAYLLVYAAGLILGARLGRRHGFGRVYLWGVAVFTAASLVCGLAVDPAMLVISRAAQGLGAALLVPQVLSLLQTAFDGERRRRALALYGMVLAVGVAVGQVLGGLLVSADLAGTSWRPIFLVNVPVGIAVLTSAARRRLPSTPTARQGLDLAGAGLLAVAVAALVVAVTFGGDAGWPWWCWPLLVVFAASLALLVRRERLLARRGAEPLVHPELLAGRDVKAGLVGVLALMGCYGGLLFTAALYLQQALHRSPLVSGLTFAAYAVGFATASLTWTRLPAAWHACVPVCGFAAVAAATAVLAWATSGGSWPPVATGLLVVAGAGHGSGFGALVQRTAAAVPAGQAATFSGVLSTVIQLAIATGIAAAATLYHHAPSRGTVPAFTITAFALSGIQVLIGGAVVVALRRGAGGEQAQRQGRSATRRSTT